MDDPHYRVYLEPRRDCWSNTWEQFRVSHTLEWNPVFWQAMLAAEEIDEVRA